MPQHSARRVVGSVGVIGAETPSALVLQLRSNDPKLGQEFIGVDAPAVGFGVYNAVVADAVEHSLSEVVETDERPRAEYRTRELAEPALDLVEPRALLGGVDEPHPMLSPGEERGPARSVAEVSADELLAKVLARATPFCNPLDQLGGLVVVEFVDEGPMVGVTTCPVARSRLAMRHSVPCRLYQASWRSGLPAFIAQRPRRSIACMPVSSSQETTRTFRAASALAAWCNSTTSQTCAAKMCSSSITGFILHRVRCGFRPPLLANGQLRRLRRIRQSLLRRQPGR